MWRACKSNSIPKWLESVNESFYCAEASNSANQKKTAQPVTLTLNLTKQRGLGWTHKHMANIV